VQKLLPDEVALLTGQRDERDDLVGDALLLLKRERHRLGCASELRTRRLHAGDRHR
jgi:hypothetical protein